MFIPFLHRQSPYVYQEGFTGFTQDQLIERASLLDEKTTDPEALQMAAEALRTHALVVLGSIRSH